MPPACDLWFIFISTLLGIILLRKRTSQSQTRCQSYKAQNIVKYQKKWLKCKKLDCFLIGKILTYMCYKLGIVKLQKICCKFYRIGSRHDLNNHSFPFQIFGCYNRQKMVINFEKHNTVKKLYKWIAGPDPIKLRKKICFVILQCYAIAFDTHVGSYFS